MLKMRFCVSKFVRTKMRLKEGAEIELQRDIFQICQICRFVRFVNFRDLKKRETDGPTDRWTDGRTDGQTLL